MDEEEEKAEEEEGDEKEEDTESKESELNAEEVFNTVMGRMKPSYILHAFC